MLKFNCDPTYVKCNSMLWNFSDFLEVVFYFRAKRSMMSAYKTYYEERAKALGNCQKLDYILSFPRLLCSASSTGKKRSCGLNNPCIFLHVHYSHESKSFQLYAEKRWCDNNMNWSVHFCGRVFIYLLDFQANVFKHYC